MKNTVLFDLDGTLVDSLQDITDSVNYTMNKMNFPLRTLDEIKMFVGNGAEMLIKRALPIDKKDFFDGAIKIYKDHYRENVCNKTKPFDGIYELITELDEKGYNIGIVTNKPQPATDIVAQKLFKGKIKAVVGADLSKRQNKPEPDGVELCLKMLGANKEDAVYVGDSEVDVATSVNSGLYSIGVTWGNRGAEALKGADVIVNSVKELREILIKE